MPNDPKAARQKRTPPAHRQNAQGDHEGSAHSPDEFDAQNPQKLDRDEKEIGRPTKVAQADD